MTIYRGPDVKGSLVTELPKYPLVRRLQNSPLTSWWWSWFMDDITGEIVLLPRFSCPSYPFIPYRKKIKHKQMRQTIHK